MRPSDPQSLKVLLSGPLQETVAPPPPPSPTLTPNSLDSNHCLMDDFSLTFLECTPLLSSLVEDLSVSCNRLQKGVPIFKLAAWNGAPTSRRIDWIRVKHLEPDCACVPSLFSYV